MKKKSQLKVSVRCNSKGKCKPYKYTTNKKRVSRTPKKRC